MGIRRTSILVAILLGSVMMAGCLPQAARIELGPDEKLQITRAVWNDFVAYKSKGLVDGAFVVSEMGDRSGYAYCPGFRCRPYNYTRIAIDLCEEAGIKCVLFAKDWTILVDYEIVD